MRSAWIFNLGADVYGWFTASAAWRASCVRLASRLDNLENGATIVDLGCGPGVSTFELARQFPRVRLVGLDIAPRMLSEARRRRRGAGLFAQRTLPARADQRQPNAQLSWLRADAAALPFATASLDACTGHSFLYLVANRDAVLAEVRRVLQPGGRLVLMEPNARAVTPGQVLAISRDPRHLLSVSLWRPFSRLHGRFSPRTLRAILERAGFVRCDVSETFNGLGLLASGEAPPAR